MDVSLNEDKWLCSMGTIRATVRMVKNHFMAGLAANENSEILLCEWNWAVILV